MKMAGKTLLALASALMLLCGCRSSSGEKAPTPRQESSIAVEHFTTAHGSIDLYCICHGTVALRFNADVAKDSRTILIDPISSLYGRRIGYGGIPKADAVLITHGHGDHLDAEAVRSRIDKDGAVFATRAVCDSLGFGEAMDNGDSRSISSAITVKAIPAYNTTPKHRQYHPKGEGNGYLLKIDGFTVYVAGDTEPTPAMHRLGDVDLAFLPVNQPYTMTPAQCAKAARTIRPGLLIPYHTGETDLEALAKALDKAKVNFIIHEELR